jgi:hypothetical protein
VCPDRSVLSTEFRPTAIIGRQIVEGPRSAVVPDASFDVFLSYHRAPSLALALALRHALVAAGCSVFLDEDEVDDFASITRRLTEALAVTKALVAIYGTTYPTRRACQFELTAAFLAGEREGDPRRRVLAVNPDDGVAHIEPVELRDALFARAPDATDPIAVADLAGRIAHHVSTLEGDLGEIAPLTVRPWFGLRSSGSSRFVGRVQKLWAIHSALHEHEFRPLTGIAAPGLTQVVGLAGIGKTLLAEEYALRFGPAYPGGVFWLRASDAPTRGDREAERSRQVRGLATELGVSLEGPSTSDEVEAAVRWRIEQRGERCLWVVDDVPAGLEADEFRRWLAPHPLADTLATTQSREYSAFGRTVDAGLLEPTEAVELLHRHRSPADEVEEQQAVQLAADLDHHALALDVAGAAVRFEAGATPYADFRAALAVPTADELEDAAQLSGVLPTGHEPSITVTLLRSIASLGDDGRDFLRLASSLASAPIPADFIDIVLAKADNLEERDSRRRGNRARKLVEMASLAERVSVDPLAHTVHGLVSRTVFLRDEQVGRREALRGTAVGVLNERLPAVVDLRAEADIEPLVVHVRELTRDPQSGNEGLLLGWLSRYELAHGQYGAAVGSGERAHAALARVWGPKHFETLIAQGNLATALRLAGQSIRAMELEQDVYVGFQETLGSEHLVTLQSLNNLLGSIGTMAGHKETRKAREFVLQRFRGLLGPEDPWTLTAMSNVVGALLDDGEFDEARNLADEVLATRMKLLGPDHLDTLAAMTNLAATLSATKRLSEAQELDEKVYAGRHLVLGPEHPLTIETECLLADRWQRMDELERAHQAWTHIADVQRRVLGPEHPKTVAAMQRLEQISREDGGGSRRMRDKPRQDR